MKIAIHGLGRMGMQIAEKLVQDGHEVVAHNRSPEPIAQAKAFGAKAAFTKQEVLEAFADEQLVLWIMLPADVIENELNAWLDIAPKGSLFIDGGNTDFRRTQKHAELVTSRGSTLLDVGTSGGILGQIDGFCMMAGGDKASVEVIKPALDSIAKPHGGWDYFGPSGAGHFVKMTHNAIEYGMMESLAEGYRVLKEGPYKNLDLAKAGDVWQKSSVITSTLNRLTAEALHENPTLEGIDGFVAESGEARWTLEVGKASNIDMPSIQASFDVRVASQKGQTNFATKVLAAMRNKFGGHALNKAGRQ
ncbi:MAG TPA: NADP-dependent phosphogluconate dehydrogenase [Candidatus Saccharimonadales bacterium]|jgi:6-phosphogluconate dehydrogenase